MDFLNFWIGTNEDSILWWQMVCRSILIFFFALMLIRIAGIRVFGKSTGFDIVLSIILGSILSRALTANSPFLPTLAAATALVFLHRVLSILSFKSKRIGQMIKGKETVLVENGRFLEKAMRSTAITRHDLEEALRIRKGTTDPGKVDKAFLERSGDISIIEKGSDD
jgi:uncharacterized membrane protein YcaP (DUF421 family)